jgi:hypothetical protein
MTRVSVTHNLLIEGQIRDLVWEAVEDCTEFMLDEANKGVPHDEGILQASGLASFDESNLSGAVSYNTPYAVRLHEHPEFRFQKGRRGKWVELAFQENQDTLQRYVHDKVSRFIGR